MTIDNTPFVVSFAGNPMRYKCLGGGKTGGVGTGWTISVDNLTSVDGDEMIVSFFGVERTIRTMDVPSRIFDLPSSSGFTTYDDYASAIFDRIIAIPLIIANYSVTLDANQIHISGPENPAFNFAEVSNLVDGLKNTMTQGVLPSTNSEGVKIEIRRAVDNLLMGTDYKSFGSNSSVTFDISEYVRAQLLKDFIPPAFHLSKTDGTTYAWIQHSLRNQFVAWFYEKVNGAFVAKYVDPPARFAIAGGLNQEGWREQLTNLPSFATTDYFTQYSSFQRFLSWAPIDRFVSKKHPISLYYLFQEVQDTTDPVQLMCTVNYTREGIVGDHTFIIKNFHYDALYYQVVEILAGYEQLDIEHVLDDSLKLVTDWQIWIGYGEDNAPSPYMNGVTFNLDRNYYENERYFIFKNSFGVFDSFRCTGKFLSIVEHERTLISSIPFEPETYFNAPRKVMLTEETQVFKGNTGWVSKPTLRFLRDFLRSNEIYEVGSSSQLFSCILTSKKTQLFEDKDFNYNLSFEYERAYTDMYYSQYQSEPAL